MVNEPDAIRRVLLVDDDPVTIRIYRDGLARRGFEVTTATDGLAALQALRAGRPEVLILDLMMPKFSGVEVLKFLRGQPELHTLPVIVLSNAYMDSLAKEASKLDVQKALLKIKCNADSLAAAIREVLEGRPVTGGIDQMLAAPAESPPVKPKPIQPPPAPRVPEPLPPAAAPPPPHWDQTPAPLTPAGLDSKEVARQEFAMCSQRMGRQLRECLDLFNRASDAIQRKLRLEDLHRKAHFLTGLAALAGYAALAQMSSAFEALVYGLMDKLPESQPSMELTMAQAVEFLHQLLQQPAVLPTGPQRAPAILVVDDDRLSARMVVTALRNAQLQARGTESPELALSWLKEKPYDLVLLDIEMPGMNGFEVCKRIRALPGYDKTPVIYVTFHSDFETHSKSELSCGNDLISKPIVPTELAVKAVMHLLKTRLAKATG